MLTPEQEKERAIKISGLYDKTDKVIVTENSDPSVAFPAYRLWKLALILLLPIVAINILVTLFLGLNYNFTADIQGASIVFIAAFIVISLLLWTAVRFFRRKTSSLMHNEGFLFLLIILFLVPLILLIRLFFDFSLPFDGSLFILKLGVYSFMLFLFSSGYIVMLAYILEKNENQKRYLIAGLLAIVPGLLYSIASQLN